jgi:hypothetical protein
MLFETIAPPLAHLLLVLAACGLGFACFAAVCLTVAVLAVIARSMLR